MKQRDLVFLLLAVVIFLVCGYVGYTQLMPKKAKVATVEVEKVGVFTGNLDQSALTQIGDGTKVTDFGLPTDLTGLGNTAPFGP